MLEAYFSKTSRLRQLRRGPFGSLIDGLAGELQRGGYAHSTAGMILSHAGKFSLFARSLGVTEPAELDEALVGRYLSEELPAEGAFHHAPNAMQHVLDHLRRCGILAPVVTKVASDPMDELLAAFDIHLKDVRGLQPSTRDGYQRVARRFLMWLREHRAGRTLRQLTGGDVLAFMSDIFRAEHSSKGCRSLCSAIRVFLRYLAFAGIASSGLERSVPKSRRWKLSTVPRHLPWNMVHKLVDSIDVTYADGLRDKAVILVLAMLGLRNADLRLMEVSHLDWRAGLLRLPKTKSRKARVLPMPKEVGAALADYLLHGRPARDLPFVFLRHKAPIGPLTTSCAVAAIVRWRLGKANIEAPTRGAHLLRHSLGTRLVNAGVPIKTIADILGHQSIDTTAIYTKVDVARLALAALPFPAEAP